MKRNGTSRGRSEAEIRSLVTGYEKSGKTRAVYCAERGLPVTTLDYYRWRLRRNKPALLEIDIRGNGTAAGRTAAPPSAEESVALVMRNGRRVEIGWGDLDRVTRHSPAFRALLNWLEEA